MKIEMADAARLLEEMEDIVIVTHSHPDGDTLGAGYALCRGLRQLGKRARVICPDPIPAKYQYLWQQLSPLPDFTPTHVVAVDVAAIQLLGALEGTYAGRFDLCIDHHPSNELYAKATWLQPKAAATAEMMYQLLVSLGVTFDRHLANCIYTGLSTDTGCFKYANTTPQTMRIAAEMMEYGADAAAINRVMFDTKSRSCMELEKLAIASLEFHLDGCCAMMYITQDMYAKSHSDNSECEGLASIPRQAEGVQVGITLRENPDGSFKASVRTDETVSACAICSLAGGGGHLRAAGCTLPGPLPVAKEAMLRYVRQVLEESGYPCH